jgi:hypothetical protein
MPHRETNPAKALKHRDKGKIDEQVEESFPASDPPAFMGGKHIIGAPKKRETPAPECVKPKK